MHALEIEGVVRLAEELLVGRAAVERGIVLAGHEVHILHPQILDDVLELGHALAPLRRIVGGMGQIAGEDDEVGLVGERIDLGHRLAQGALRIGIHRRPLEAPVRIGQLHEVEVLADAAGVSILVAGLGLGEPGQAGGEYHASHAGEAQELPAIDSAFHECSLGHIRGWTLLHTGAGWRIFPASATPSGIKAPRQR